MVLFWIHKFVGKFWVKIYHLKILFLFWYFLLKGSVGIISNKCPCKDGNVWFTTVPFNINLIKNVGKKCISVNLWTVKPQMKINRLETKSLISISNLIRQAYNGIVVNRTLPSLRRASLVFSYSPFKSKSNILPKYLRIH